MALDTVDEYRNRLSDVPVLPSFRYVKPYTENRRVLDLGCGTGNYLSFFSKDSVGIDASLPNLEMCAQKGLDAREGNLNAPLEFNDREFDVVFCSHVLEHVEAPIRLLRECNRVLEEAGYGIIGLPTEIGLPNLILNSYWDPVAHPDHLYGFTLPNLEVLLRETGFILERVFIEPGLIARLRLWFLLDWLQRIPPRFALWLSNGYWAIARKQTDLFG